MRLSSEIQINDDSLVQTCPLISQPAPEGKIYLGCKETGNFLIADHYWEVLTHFFNKPLKVNELSDTLQDLFPKYFISGQALSKTKLMIMHMIKQGIITKIDNKQIGSGEVSQSHTLKRNKLLSIIFSPPFIVFYTLLSLSSFFLLLSNKIFIPKPQDFFWSNTYSLCLLTFFIFSWLISFLHELAHFLSAKSQGIKGKIRLSHRLNFLVIQTSYPNIYSLNKNWRIFIYLSGIILDLIVISILYLVIKFNPNINPLIFKLIKQVILLQWLSFLWNFVLYLRTDSYFVVKELLQIDNLYIRSQQWIKHIFLGKPFLFKVSKREKIIINFYSAFFLVGILVSVIRYGYYQLPITINLFTTSISKLYLGYINNNIQMYIDGAIVLYIEVAVSLLLIYSIYKDKRII
ncbi:hypothetical protein KW795_01690 [Candidatus Microgenomates bacterium]|nr:hypothetical protein [Candidatus Microgenomates bacterium]